MIRGINIIRISSGSISFSPRKNLVQKDNYVLVNPNNIRTIKGIEENWCSKPKTNNKRYVRRG